MNKNILNNQEHREALQLEANRRAIEYHGEEKFNKVHEALKFLTDAGIDAIIFANTGENKVALQVNNHSDFMEFEGGVATDASVIKSINNNHKWGNAFTTYFHRGLKDNSDNPEFELGNIIGILSYHYKNKIEYGTPLPEEVRFLNENS